MNEKEKAVIDAAIEGKDILEEWQSLDARGWDDDWKPVQALIKIANAVRALQEPEPVRPEEVEPGQKFRFHDDIKEEADCIMLESDTGDGLPRLFMREGQPIAFTFPRNARIIPIKEGSEE